MIDDYLKINKAEFNIYNTLPVARPGLPFILILLGLTLTLGLFEVSSCLTFISFLLLVFTVWFFRDPIRAIPQGDFGLAPADGQIIKIEDIEHCEYLDGPAKKISIFMNVFNVHVNRVPIDGRIIKQAYHPGDFFNASLDKASELNERNAIVLEDKNGQKIAMVQIAGLIARRIISWVNEEDELIRGQRFGMIRFGSRVDLYLPKDAEIMVTNGQKVNGGWSPIWRL